MRYQPRVQQTPQEALTAALPMPPASHQRKKSHCSLKSRQRQNRTRRDLADHGKGGDQAEERRGDPSGGLRRRQPRAPRTGQRCRRGQAQHSPPAPAPGAAEPTPRRLGQTPSSAPTHRANRSCQASTQPRPAAKRRLVPLQPCWGYGFYWESDPTSHAFREVRLSVRPEATRELFAAGPLPLNLTTLMNPGHSAFELQHFLELPPGK